MPPHWPQCGTPTTGVEVVVGLLLVVGVDPGLEVVVVVTGVVLPFNPKKAMTSFSLTGIL
jgi:hypothetical protein